MMLWFDILTPKQLFYFTSLVNVFRRKGYKIILTARRYEQLDGLIGEFFKDWEIRIIGRFGGYGLRDKLEASVERLKLLLDEVPIGEVDLISSSGSVEASRIAYGIKKPHILASDSPHSPVNPLTAPISRRVITPWVIDVSEWTKYGLKVSQIKKYKVLDPYFWLKDFHPDSSTLKNLNIEDEYALIRLPESAASYLMINDAQYVRMLARFIEVIKNYGLKTVIMSRYREQTEAVEKLLSDNNVILVNKPVIGSHLIHYSRVFIGGGGTMTQEAALLGKPCISIYPSKQPTILRFLSKKGLVKHYTSLEESLRALQQILRKIDYFTEVFGENSRKLWKMMRDPEEELIECFEGALSS